LAVLEAGLTAPGIYNISLPDEQNVQVFCKDGLTLIQKRTNGAFDFNQTWEEYRGGFGQGDGVNYWMGLEVLHRLTSSKKYVMLS
jgi:hypothetical protein